MNDKKAKQLRKMFPGNQNAYFHAKKKYKNNKSINKGDFMRTKEEITKEFAQVKMAKEEFDNKSKQCEVRMSQLQGQFELLELEEKEKGNTKTKEKVVEKKTEKKELKN